MQTVPGSGADAEDGRCRVIVYLVKYYDAKLSKKGRGVQVRSFTDRQEAEKFAAENRIYAGHCRVEPKEIAK